MIKKLRFAVRLSALAGAGVFVWGCTGSSDERAGLVRTDSAGVQVILAPPPGTGAALIMRPAGQWGMDAPIRRIADARAISAGQIGVLDDVTGELWIVHTDSDEAFSVGGISRPFPPARSPTAFALTGDTIAVWDRALSVFTLFDAEGRFSGTLPVTVRGDAAALSHRQGSELQDLRLRLRATPTSLWLQIEDNENEMIDPDVRGVQEVPRRGYIITLRRYGVKLDTQLIYQASTRYVEFGPPSFTGMMFLPQVRWSVNQDLFAYGRSDTAEVRVYDVAGGLRAIVRWSPVGKRLDNGDKRAHARAYVREYPELAPPDALDPKNAAMLNEVADGLRMAEFAPEFSGIEVAGSCIWVAPFDFSDNADGMSRNWSYYNFETARTGTVVFDTTAVKITYIGDQLAIGRHIDANTAVHSVRWYTLPGTVARDCSRQ